MTVATFTLGDLILAYRKAKADLFYERDHVGAIKFSLYENDLLANLQRLHARLCANKPDWMTDAAIVGDFAYIPKSCDLKPDTDGRIDSKLVTITSDPVDAWRSSKPRDSYQPTFRMIGDHPVDYHVISALWILQVGYLFDTALSGDAYGSRLRRDNDGTINPVCIGSFKPYSFAFRSWRDGGLKAAVKEVDRKGGRAVAITADLRKFYHQTSPNYLLDSSWLEMAGVTLTKAQRRFTRQFIASMHFWAGQTPLLSCSG